MAKKCFPFTLEPHLGFFNKKISFLESFKIWNVHFPPTDFLNSKSFGYWTAFELVFLEPYFLEKYVK